MACVMWYKCDKIVIVFRKKNSSFDHLNKNKNNPKNKLLRENITIFYRKKPALNGLMHSIRILNIYFKKCSINTINMKNIQIKFDISF